MLPSFRLIMTTFLCGFAVVFVSLRLVGSLHTFRGKLPVMAAHAAPMPIMAIVGPETRHGQAMMPVMYDLRIIVRAATLAPVPEQTLASAIDRAAPLPATIGLEPYELTKHATSVAAIVSERTIELAPAIPQPVVVPPVEPSRQDLLAVAAIGPLVSPATNMTVLDQSPDAPAAIIVKIPLPRAAKRPTVADSQPALEKQADSMPTTRVRRVRRTNQNLSHNWFDAPKQFVPR